MRHESRRRFLQSSLSLIGLGVLAGCGSVLPRAQQPAKIHRVGLLTPGTMASSAPSLDAFRQGLRDLGYMEGQNIVLEIRYGEGRQERLPEQAGEFARENVDVIVTSGLAAIRAAGQATTTIPIVFATAGEVVEEGLIASLARPGGNITGLTLIAGDEYAKRLELLKEAAPGISRVAVLWTQSGALRGTETAGPSLGVQILSLKLSSPDDLDSVLAAAIAGGADGFIWSPGAGWQAVIPRVVDFAAQHRLPGMSLETGFARAGGLMEHRPNITDMHRRAAAYVDKILRGAKAADLPVEQPTKFDLVINLRTAGALGLTFPPSVLAAATEIVQ